MRPIFVGYLAPWAHSWRIHRWPGLGLNRHGVEIPFLGSFNGREALTLGVPCCVRCVGGEISSWFRNESHPALVYPHVDAVRSRHPEDSIFNDRIEFRPTGLAYRRTVVCSHPAVRSI